MKVIAVIPSRWGSTRFPGKSVQPILGKPLLGWVIEAVRKARRPDEVIVATDDERIVRVAAEAGARAVMTRSDHPSGTDRVAEAAGADGEDIVINIQGDEPLIDPGLIDSLADCLAEHPGVQMATAACPVRDRDELNAASVVKVVTNARGEALYFSRLPVPARRDAPPDPASGLYRRHLGIYAYRGAFLRRLVATPPCPLEVSERLEQLRALYIGARILVLDTAEAGIGVDEPGDIGYIEEIMRKRGLCRAT